MRRPGKSGTCSSDNYSATQRNQLLFVLLLLLTLALLLLTLRLYALELLFCVALQKLRLLLRPNVVNKAKFAGTMVYWNAARVA